VKLKNVPVKKAKEIRAKPAKLSAGINKGKIVNKEQN
jgi:hypothetical protein